MTDIEYVEMGIIARKVREASDFIQEVKPYQLQLLPVFINRERGKIAELISDLLLLPENQHVTEANFPEWKDLADLEQVVKVERDRRAGKVAPKKKISEPKPQKDLPSLEDVLRIPDRLDFLWEHLIRQQRKSTRDTDLFDNRGYTGGLERSASVLMAITDGLRLCAQIKEGYTEGDVYTILCNRYNATPTKQRSKTRKRAIYKDVKDWVMVFYGK